MSITSIELWERIQAEKLATADECRTWAAETATLISSTDAADGLKVLLKLIELGKLTKYQAKVLSGQWNRPLRQGKWLILGLLKPPLWESWTEIIAADSTDPDGQQPSWGRWLSRTELDTMQELAPSLPRGMKLASANCDFLQQVFIPQLEGTEEGETQLLIRVKPVSGDLLSDRFKDQRCAPQAADRIVAQAAEGLRIIHDQGMVHGRLLPDRIYWDGESACLVCDPLVSKLSGPKTEEEGILSAALHQLSQNQFLAPEFLAPGQQPTARTDVYGLGMIWWWLVHGTTLSRSAELQACLAAAAAGPSAELVPRTATGQVLQHALAPNPAHRFGDGGQLLLALQRASGLESNQPILLASQQPNPSPDREEIEALASAKNVDPKSAEHLASTRPIVASPVVAEAKSSQNPRVVAKLARDVKKVDTQSRQNTPQSTGSDKRPQQPVQAKVISGKLDRETHTPTVPTNAPELADKRTTESSQKDSVLAEPANPLGENSGVGLGTADKPVPSGAAPVTPASTSGSVRSIKRRKRSRKNSKWMLPVFGGAGTLIVLLLLLKLSGVFEGAGRQDLAPNAVPGAPTTVLNSAANTDRPDVDPLLEHFEIIDDPQVPWIPPTAPEPIALDKLPLGAGAFLSLRPADWLNSTNTRNLMATMGSQTSAWLSDVAMRCGASPDEIEHLLVAAYEPEREGGFPQLAYRVRLTSPKILGDLKAKWSITKTTQVGDHALLVRNNEAFYVSTQPLVDAQSVQVFSLGPESLMQEVAELKGAAGPLVSAVEKLWLKSNANSDLSLIAAAPFVFAEGRGILNALPNRAQQLMRQQFGRDTKALGISMTFDPDWYMELQIVGASDQEAGRTLAGMQNTIENLPASVEQWMVSQSPHPHWRALALRFPQMLRALKNQSRFGVEDGAAIINFYLPSAAAPNVLKASWIAMQDAAMLSGSLANNTMQPTAAALTIDQYLERKIKIRFSQEPIEVALQLVGDEANDDLPSGTPKLRFELDGDAFEIAGITRNQQLSDFQFEQTSVREALTEIAKRGNNVPNVPDTRNAAQELIWVIKDDAQRPGAKMVSLTTRTAATKAQIALPVEFAP